MPSLLDVGKLTKPVSIPGADGKVVQVEVSGLSGSGFLHLLERFPEFRKLMSGGAVEADMNVVLQQAPGAANAVIAHACGNPDDKEAEAIAGNLPAGVQVEILVIVWELTFPRGVRNFTAALEGLAQKVAIESGWAVDTKSPGQSNGASKMATEKPPGDTPHDKCPPGSSSASEGTAAS